MDLEKKLDELNFKIHASLGLSEPEELPYMRVRLSRLALRHNPLLLNTSLSFFLKIESVGETHYKCKTHLAHYIAPDPNTAPPPSSTVTTDESQARATAIHWNKDKVKFDCKVDDHVRIQVFCTLNPAAVIAADAAAGPGKDGKGGAKGKEAPKRPDKKADKKDAKESNAEAPGDGAVALVPKLQQGQSHFVGEAVVRLRLAFDARRTKDFRWHNLSDLSEGGAGLSSFAGQVGFQLETMDFSAARMPKPPPQVEHIACQTDFAQARANNRAGDCWTS